MITKPVYIDTDTIKVVPGAIYQSEVKPFGAGSGYIPFKKKHVGEQVLIIVLPPKKKR